MTKTNAMTAAETVSLSKLLSQKTTYTRFTVWIIGDTPLICHAWSYKARLQMLQKQVKATKGGKEERDPKGDFLSSLYEMAEGCYGFPVTAFKNAILSAAHKDKGIARSIVMNALWLDAEMIRTQPALAGAICDMPLVRIWSDKPEMREDMVKIGTGLNKIANLAYRGQFTNWAVRLTGKFNNAALTIEQLIFLLQDAGMGSGVGEWRNERKGIFGAFHIASPDEEGAWVRFANKKGPLPIAASVAAAAE